MALTNSRWIMLALAGFLLSPVLVFISSEREPYQYSQRDRLQARAGRAQGRARETAERVRTRRLADSIRIAMAVPATSAPRVILDRSLDTTSRRLLSSLARDATEDRTGSPRVATDIVFVVDTSKTVDGVLRRGFTGAIGLNYLLPRAETAGRCIVIARIRPWGLNEFRADASRERLLGPCAFYEAFGAPGPAIARWLNEGGWSYAQSNWNGGPVSARAPWLARDDYPLRYVLGSRGVACAKGNESACAAAIEKTEVMTSRMRDGILTTDFNPYILTSSWYSREWDFGMRSPALLADIVRDLGPERFARFWTSDAEPFAAFRAASGTDLSRWTQLWLQRTYHEEKSGPGVSAEALAWGFAILALAFGLIVRTSERRQMA